MLLFIPYWVNGQLVISSSGDYTLGTNVSGSTGILINASNVTLDLAGLTVSSSATGITIAAGLSNIIIKNGIITTSVTGIVINQNCFNIQLQDLVIQNCTTRAVQIVGSLGNLIQRISLSNILINGCCTSGAALTCIAISFANDVQMNDVSLIANGPNANSLTLIGIDNAERAILEDVEIANNSISSGTLTGISCGTTTQSCVFNSCLVLDNSSSAAGVFRGFAFTTATSIDHMLSKCQVINNQLSAAGALQLYGFYFQLVLRIQVQACVAYGNINNGTGASSSCYGFYLDQGDSYNLLDNQSFLNRAPNNGTTNEAAGFFLGTTGAAGTGVKNSDFINNIAYLNNGQADARSYGFEVATPASATGNQKQ